MKTIRFAEALFYYDGPEVIECRDAEGGAYVGVHVPGVGDAVRYLVTAVTEDRLRQFRLGKVDLRAVLLAAGSHEWYLTDDGRSSSDGSLELLPQSAPLAEFDDLPDEGFLLPAPVVPSDHASSQSGKLEPTLRA